MAADTVTWVSDTLMTLIGFADKTLAEYMVEVAKKSQAPAQLLQHFQQNEIPVNDASQRFAIELWKRMPRAAAPMLHAAARQPSNAEMLRQSAKYKMVDNTTPHSGDARASSSASVVSSTLASSLARDGNGNIDRKRGDDNARDKRTRSRSRSRSRERSRDNDKDAATHKKRHLRKKDAAADSSSDDERPIRSGGVHAKRGRTYEAEDEQRVDGGGGRRPVEAAAAEDDLDPEERARLQDQLEKSEFEKRLAERESKMTKKTGAGQSDGRGGMEGDAAAAALDLSSLPAEERDRALADLRKLSRRQYLEKREQRELALLEEQVRLNEDVFGVDKLTREERQRHDLNKAILEVARGKGYDGSGRGRTEASVIEEAPRYRMPDAMEEVDENGRPVMHKGKRDQLLHARYSEPGQGGGAGAGAAGGTGKPKSEQAAWEEQQLAGARLKFGSGTDGKAARGSEYEYVFDESTMIDFAESDTLKGDGIVTGTSAAAAGGGSASDAAATAKTEHEKLLAVRKTLPIFPYRDDLLQAIADHQVLVVVGETGSGKTTQVRGTAS